MKNVYLEVKNITKKFPGVVALDDVSMDFRAGEVLGLLGENGAGKSTLMKVIGGIHAPDHGEIYVQGVKQEHWDAKHALQCGIGFVHQELNLAESVSVAENIYMGNLPYLNKSLGIVDYKTLYENTKKCLARIKVDLNPETIVDQLKPAQKQLIEISKALSKDCKMIIFDEPTTSLADDDVSNLFSIIQQLKKEGLAIVYISHRLNEIFQICDRVSVLRDSRFIDSRPIDNLTQEDIIRLMVAREITELYPKMECLATEEVVLEADGLYDDRNFIQNASMHLYKGEILGIGGLVGAGRTELVRLLFGADRISKGTVKINGKTVALKSPKDAIREGLCLLTEDRKQQGLFLDLSVCDNINIANIDSAVLNHKKLKERAESFKQSIEIKTSSLDTESRTLSGGNQQKVVLAKWLNTDCSIFIFDEPTKGIDVGAKTEIYKIMNTLIEQGKSVIMISSEMPELLGMCDRTYVMCEGRITGELHRDEFSQEKIMTFATAGGNHED